MITRQVTALTKINQPRLTVPSPEVDEAISFLHRNGFEDVETSQEDGRNVITIQSTVLKINAGMNVLKQASSKGILIRCRSENPLE